MIDLSDCMLIALPHCMLIAPGSQVMKFQGMHPGRVSIYAREVWSAIDADGDGKISKAEAMRFISQ